jgi:hypothetical protein
LDFGKFWRLSGFQYWNVFRNREVFIGADIDPQTGEIGVSEYSIGDEDSVGYQEDHLINFHTEPPGEGWETPVEAMLDQIPDAYFDDVSDFVNDDGIMCEIIMRMIDDNCGVVVLLKTSNHVKVKCHYL